MRKQHLSRYDVLVANKPGELAKLTALLTREKINVSGMTVASAGGIASIQFTAPTGKKLPERLRESGVKVLETRFSHANDALRRKEVRHLIGWLGRHGIPIYSLRLAAAGRDGKTILTVGASEDS